MREQTTSAGSTVVLLLLFFGACLLFYADTLRLEFTAEDYLRINRHYRDLTASPLGPLRTPPTFSPRFRPVQFYTLALEYRLFGTHILLYRLLDLALLAAVASLFHSLLRNALGVRPLPAAAGALMAVFYFTWVDILYQYAGQFYLWGSIIFVLLLRLVFSPRRPRSHLIAMTALFSIGLLTVQTVVIVMPMLLFHFLSEREKGRGTSVRTLLTYGFALSVPLFAFLLVERWRSGPLPVLTSSAFAVLKNYVVFTGCLFYNFKPFGFTQVWQATGPNLATLTLFVQSNRGVAAMGVASLVFTAGALLLLWRGDHPVRLLTLGVVLNILVFSAYPGTTPRYLTVSVLCTIALTAYAWSRRVTAGSGRLGLLLFAALLAYNWRISVKEREPFLADIHHTEALRRSIGSNQNVSPADLPAVLQLKEFWKE